MYRKSKHTLLVQLVLFPKRFMRYMEKYGRTRQATDDNKTIRVNDAICMPEELGQEYILTLTICNTYYC